LLVSPNLMSLLTCSHILTLFSSFFSAVVPIAVVIVTFFR